METLKTWLMVVACISFTGIAIVVVGLVFGIIVALVETKNDNK